MVKTKRIGKSNFNFLFFNDRKILDKVYKKWLKEGSMELSDTSFNMINFLLTKGLINIPKTKEFINQEENDF